MEHHICDSGTSAISVGNISHFDKYLQVIHVICAQMCIGPHANVILLYDFN
jgi:hypothetical protein